MCVYVRDGERKRDSFSGGNSRIYKRGSFISFGTASKLLIRPTAHKQAADDGEPLPNWIKRIGFLFLVPRSCAVTRPPPAAGRQRNSEAGGVTAEVDAPERWRSRSEDRAELMRSRAGSDGRADRFPGADEVKC